MSAKLLQPLPPPGQRERNKEEKRRAICAAARRQFIEHGYEAATTREIAQEAGIATGTLFTYAVDKRDLLFFIINDDILAAIAEVQAVQAATQPDFLAGLLAMFRPLYELFAQDALLFREALKELQLGAPGVLGQHTARFEGIRGGLRASMAAFMAAAQGRGWITPAEPSEFIGGTLFALYQVEVRLWLAGAAPDVETGLAALARRFALLLRGLAV